ncbi:MGMT family protein [Paenibacillus sp. MBLB4367]|uniref:MGMT family protein n=1 Tax=Paenibacillus sp. MBLB4367 TaxID=3384767 RepID=UPI00390838AC
MEPFTLRVIEVIKSIPEGYVMTYGQIARQAGSPRAARQVVRILHALSGIHKLPWHRVVNAKGEIAIQNEESRFLQMMYLEQEGVTVVNGRVELESFRFAPHPD